MNIRKYGRDALMALVGLLIGGLVVYLWPTSQPRQEYPVNAPRIAQAAPQLKSAPVATVKLAKCTVQAYKPSVKVRAHLLPKAIADSPKQAIVASSRIEPDDHPETVTTTLDTDTGAAVQSVVREPLPWLAVDTKREASVDLVAKTSGPVIRIQARQDFLQVKALHFHVMAGGDIPVPVMGMMGKPDACVGVGVHAAW